MLWLAPVVALLLLFGPSDVFTKIATFFSTMAVVTFGGAFTVIPYLHDAAVNGHHWLTEGQFVDGLALSGVLPAPLIIVTNDQGLNMGYSPTKLGGKGVFSFFGASQDGPAGILRAGGVYSVSLFSNTTPGGPYCIHIRPPPFAQANG